MANIRKRCVGVLWLKENELEIWVTVSAFRTVVANGRFSRPWYRVSQPQFAISIRSSERDVISEAVRITLRACKRDPQNHDDTADHLRCLCSVVGCPKEAIGERPLMQVL